jgi:polyisoprenoid-binding protein YceI
MMKKTLLAVAAALLLAAACAAPKVAPAPSGALKLDTTLSTLTAVAIKNESKEVPVHFTGLIGWAGLDGKGELFIPLGGLQTGDPARDQNVKTLFFEVGKAASFAGATFKLGSVDADLAKLAEGQTLTAKALGSLLLHGASVPLAGDLAFTRQGKAISAVLGKGWAIEIDQTTLVGPLKELNANCPQPHRVGNTVALKGTLVFVP